MSGFQGDRNATSWNHGKKVLDRSSMEAERSRHFGSAGERSRGAISSTRRRKSYHRSVSDLEDYASRSYQTVVKGVSDIYDFKHYQEHDIEEEGPPDAHSETFDVFKISKPEERNAFGSVRSDGIPSPPVAHPLGDDLQTIHDWHFNSPEKEVERSPSSYHRRRQKRNLKRELVFTKEDRYRPVNFAKARSSHQSTRSSIRTGDTRCYVSPNRLLERNRSFQQSSGVVKIEQHADRESWAQILELYTFDWFHVVLTLPVQYLIMIVATAYTIVTLLFALIYLLISEEASDKCNLNSESGQPITFLATFAFSVHTTSTVGYGTLDDTPAFFKNCPKVPAVVFLHSIITIILNGLMVTFFFQRIGRADTRSHRVIFSDKAVIRCVDGKFYFSFQVYDLEKKIPLVEAHCRCYAVYSESDGRSSIEFQSRYMRLQNSDDAQGTNVFLAFPCNMFHCIDNWSPLFPPTVDRTHWEDNHDNFVHGTSNRYLYPGMFLRDTDATAGIRNSTACPVCGELFASDDLLFRHLKYVQRFDEDENESKDGLLQETATTNQGSCASDSVLNPIIDSSVSSGRPSLKFRGSNDVRRSQKFYQRTGGVKYLHNYKNKGQLKDFERINESLTHSKVDMSLLITRDTLVQHEDYLKQLDKGSQEDNAKQLKTAKVESAKHMKHKIRKHIERSNLEIIVVVEGIEPNSSNTFQARNSYNFENIVFDHWFAPCVGVDENGGAIVDLTRFHDVVPVTNFTQNLTSAKSML